MQKEIKIKVSCFSPKIYELLFYGDLQLSVQNLCNQYHKTEKVSDTVVRYNHNIVAEGFQIVQLLPEF